DFEILDLALASLRDAGLAVLTLDLADARVLKALLEGVTLSPDRLDALAAALAAKDQAALAAFQGVVPDASLAGLRALTNLYGEAEIL
ncbi:ATP phosphoribosyltransferase regulatory subunit, partial [Escherichia fergusonii]|uniref:ATP phosphoribosyltransferase regulatory subunit n=1 Tax=Escherichia fergusonii TaxID=564 RepID=UPI001CBDA6EF